MVKYVQRREAYAVSPKFGGISAPMHMCAQTCTCVFFRTVLTQIFAVFEFFKFWLLGSEAGGGDMAESKTFKWFDTFSPKFEYTPKRTTNVYVCDLLTCIDSHLCTVHKSLHICSLFKRT